jgi:hypothetical protein
VRVAAATVEAIRRALDAGAHAVGARLDAAFPAGARPWFLTDGVLHTPQRLPNDLGARPTPAPEGLAVRFLARTIRGIRVGRRSGEPRGARIPPDRTAALPAAHRGMRRASGPLVADRVPGRRSLHALCEHRAPCQKNAACADARLRRGASLSVFRLSWSSPLAIGCDRVIVRRDARGTLVNPTSRAHRRHLRAEPPTFTR